MTATSTESRLLHDVTTVHRQESGRFVLSNRKSRNLIRVAHVPITDVYPSLAMVLSSEDDLVTHIKVTKQPWVMSHKTSQALATAEHPTKVEATISELFRKNEMEIEV